MCHCWSIRQPCSPTSAFHATFGVRRLAAALDYGGLPPFGLPTFYLLECGGLPPLSRLKQDQSGSKLPHSNGCYGVRRLTAALDYGGLPPFDPPTFHLLDYIGLPPLSWLTNHSGSGASSRNSKREQAPALQSGSKLP